MPAKKRDVVANFFSKVNKDGENGCWLWTGALRANGYGVLYVKRYPVYAHRWSYEYHKGPIPEGLVVDHLCNIRHCVNPKHMEIGTQAVNVLRSSSPPALNAQKTCCPKGHFYDEENTYYSPKDGERKCRECNRVYLRERTIHRPNPNTLKTHCPKGHPYDEENTYHLNGSRYCKACMTLRDKAHRERKKEKQELPPREVRTHCPHGHVFSEENTVVNAEGYRECRTCRRERARRYRRKPIRQRDDHHTSSQWEALKAEYNYTCLCCGRQEPDIKLTADRIIPGCKGGTYNIENVQPLCKRCNFKKHTKTIDFRPQNT